MIEFFQPPRRLSCGIVIVNDARELLLCHVTGHDHWDLPKGCLLYTSDAADERSSVDLGGRRIIKKKKRQEKQTDTLMKEQNK